MKTTIYMVRHAKSPFIFGQERTRGLSEEGLMDAKKLVERFRDIHVDGIVSSPYTRAIQTVKFIAESKGLSIIEYEDLRERPIKGLDYRISEDELLKAIEQSFKDKDYCMTGGETTNAAQERALPVIESLLKEYEGKVIVIGTHGNIMTIIMNYYKDEYGYDFWRSTSIPDVYKLTFSNLELEEVKRFW